MANLLHPLHLTLADPILAAIALLKLRHLNMSALEAKHLIHFSHATKNQLFLL